MYVSNSCSCLKEIRTHHQMRFCPQYLAISTHVLWQSFDKPWNDKWPETLTRKNSKARQQKKNKNNNIKHPFGVPLYLETPKYNHLHLESLVSFVSGGFLSNLWNLFPSSSICLASEWHNICSSQIADGHVLQGGEIRDVFDLVGF